MITIRKAGLIMAVSVLNIPTAAAAQSGPDAKHNQAVSMHASGPRLTTVARLHLESARERSASDPQAQHCLSTAGHLYYYAGDKSRARRLLGEAADVALRRGDVEYAGHALLSAAVIAQEAKDGGAVRRLIERAELLTEGPALSVSQRARIRARVARGEVVAGTR